jgi:hypothetical protein
MLWRLGEQQSHLRHTEIELSTSLIISVVTVSTSRAREASRVSRPVESGSDQLVGI